MNGTLNLNTDIQQIFLVAAKHYFGCPKFKNYSFFSLILNLNAAKFYKYVHLENFKLQFYN
jgi:hypothetical protein